MKSQFKNTEYGVTHISRRHDKLVLEIDAHTATYKNIPFVSLSNWQKRKFENMLIMQNPKDKLKLIFH